MHDEITWNPPDHAGLVPADDPAGPDYARRELTAEHGPLPPAVHEAIATLAHHSRALQHLAELQRLELEPARLVDPVPQVGPPASGSTIGWTFTDQSRDQSKSVGVYNPPGNPRIFVALDTGPGGARAGVFSFPVAAGKLLVLPLPVFDITVGVDVADQGGVAQPLPVFVWRYPTLAQAYLGG